MALTSGLGGQLSIDLGALARNWRALDKVSAGALTGAVVKADAYGTGITMASKALYAAGARFFFTATPDEGMAVRAAVPEAHIFVLNGLYPGAANLYIRQNLMPVLSSMAMLEEWLTKCVERNEAYPAAFHFDTGMSRLGFRLNEASVVRERIQSLGFAPQMIMSHLACADQPNHEKNRTQLALFGSIMAQFPGIPASLSNSAGLMTGRDYHFQMVRPGIALYGGSRGQWPQEPHGGGGHAPRAHPAGQGSAAPARLWATAPPSRSPATAGWRSSPMAMPMVSSARFPAAIPVRVARSRSAASSARCSAAFRWISSPSTSPILAMTYPIPAKAPQILGDMISVDDQAEAAGTIGYEVLTSLKGRYNRNYVGDGNLPPE